MFVILLPGLILSFGLLTYLVVQRETSLFMTQSVNFARESALTITKVLQESMMEGKAEVTADFLKKLTGSGDIVLNVVDIRGNKVFMGEGALHVPDSVIKNMKTYREFKDENVYFYLPLKNERRCRGCHHTGSLRGVVVASVPFGNVKREIADTKFRFFIYGLLMMFISSAVLYIVIRKFIHQPVEQIKKGIDAYKEGSFSKMIALKGGDEFSDLAGTFNSMVERIGAFHERLEGMVHERTDALEQSRDELQEKTKTLLEYSEELRTISSFSYRFGIHDRKIKDILQDFTAFIRDELGYSYSELYYLYRYTEKISRAAVSDTDIPLKDENKLRALIFSGEVHTELESEGQYVTYLPIYLPGKGNCWDINNCSNKDCPVYGTEGSKCWNVSSVKKCRAPHTGRFLSCFQCNAFPARGLLVTGANGNPSGHSLSALELVAMEIAYISDIYELLQYERNMVKYLKQAHDSALYTSTAAGITDLFSILKKSEVLTGLFDGVALWLYGEDECLTLKASYPKEDVRSFNIAQFFQKKMPDHPLEFYDIGMGGYYSALLCPLMEGDNFLGVIGLFKSFKRIFRPEERAVAILIAQQVSYSIENIILHGDLKNQNRELRYQKEFTEKIFNSINSGIIVIDSSRKVLAANPYALGTLGFAEEDIIGSDIDKFIPGFLTTASSDRHEGYFTLCNNKTLYLGFTISHLRDMGSLHGKIILFKDLTEIMDLRKQLRRREYFSAIGEMASWLAHEVRNPLFAIASIARILLKKTGENSEWEKFVTSILKETGRLDTLMDDLLQYGKPLKLELEMVKLNDHITEVVDGLRPFASEAGSEIAILTSQPELMGHIDKDRMKQVFYNIIKNSIDASAGKIEIITEKTDNIINITVKDNGRGVKPSRLENVFTPFFTTKKTGTGLGLAICRKIIEEHGGTISMDSIDDKGTRVNITLKM